VGGGGFFLVQLGDVPGHQGETLGAPGAPARFVSPNPRLRRTAYYHPLGNTDHPGGLAMVGQILAIAASCDTARSCARQAFIEFHDLSVPGARHTRLHRFNLFRQRERRHKNYASSVAVARLSNGRHLMFVLGKADKREGWFYISNTSHLGRDTYWRYLNRYEGRGSMDDYQNTTLITECESGDMFLLGTGNSSFGPTIRGGPGILGQVLSLFKQGAIRKGRERIDLFKLALVGGRVEMTRVLSRGWKPDPHGHCNFRAGASAYVTPKGRLALYCTTRKANTDLLGLPDSKLKMAEFSAP